MDYLPPQEEDILLDVKTGNYKMGSPHVYYLMLTKFKELALSTQLPKIIAAFENRDPDDFKNKVFFFRVPAAYIQGTILKNICQHIYNLGA